MVAPVIQEFEKVNAFFQASKADPEKMVSELDVHYKTLKQRLYDTRFQSELLRCKRENAGNPQFMVSVELLLERCMQFLMELLIQVEKRLPSSKQIFQGLSGLHPNVVLSQMSRLPFSQLPFQHLLSRNPDLESQYRKLICQIFPDGLPKETAPFWLGIRNFETVDSCKPYKELAHYALACLATPVSNAIVERMFSHVTCVKTKFRNRLKLPMLEAILRVRHCLIMKGECCKKFDVTQRMFENFNSRMYDLENEDGNKFELLD
ncbi:unnamed protein product [Clavelina lepadiformis]|uniref:HAT C-terminal dimerisation domain-containing protein n=1 Tax=Clavelina lepadiformis TaxID=159417 RepID=A0ABP0FZB5_CLALP